MGNRRDIDNGWAWFVLLAVYAGFIIISTSTFMGGVLYVAFLEEYGGNEALSSLIGSLNSGLLCLCGPIASLYMNTFSCRTSIVTGGLMVSLACFSSAFVSNVSWLILTYGVLGGIGNAFVSTPFVVVLSYYFNKRRNSVITVCIAVVGLGMFLSSPMALSVLHTYGLSGSFLILSGFNANICVCGVICRPSSLEQTFLFNCRKINCSDINKNVRRNSSLKIRFTALLSRLKFNLLLNKVFTVFMLSTVTWNLMLSVFLIHLPNYMITVGASKADVAVVMTCFSVGNTAGRFMSIFVVNRMCLSNFTVHIASLSLAGILTISFPSFSYVYTLNYFFAVVSGALLGVPNSLAAPILLEIQGVELISTAHGLEYFFSGVGYIVGPPIAGFLFGKTGTYDSSFYFAGIIVLIGAIFGYVSWLMFIRTSQTTETNNVLETLTVNKLTEDEDANFERQNSTALSTVRPLIDQQ